MSYEGRLAEVESSSARKRSMTYISGTPLMRHRQSTHHRSGALSPLLGRPVQQSWRRTVLDDDLLGSDWQWDSDESQQSPTH